ncbi:MAG: hypothetical protein LC687_03195, partial [Actinobacteria bacterium]|nr:hypothetical protein [Actinomycetota bacterium]
MLRIRWTNVNSDGNEELPELVQRPYCSSSDDDSSDDEATLRCFRMGIPSSSHRHKYHATTRSQSRRRNHLDDFKKAPLDDPDPDGEESDGVIPPYSNLAQAAQCTKEELVQPQKDSGERVTKVEPDVGEYSNSFHGTSIDTLRDTFDATTRHGTRGATQGHALWGLIPSPSPILTIMRRREIATDILYSAAPVFGMGSTDVQFSIGRNFIFRSTRRLGSLNKDLMHTLYDEICKYGAVDKLSNDTAKAQLSAHAKDVLRTFAIGDWQSEPHNTMEREWGDTKRVVTSLLNHPGAPPEAWMLALECVCSVQNRTSHGNPGKRTPIELPLGYTPNIMVLLQLASWEPVLYSKCDAMFPFDGTE